MIVFENKPNPQREEIKKTPLIRALLETLIFAKLFKNFPYSTHCQVDYHIHIRTPLKPLPSHIIPVHVTKSPVLSLNFIY